MANKLYLNDDLLDALDGNLLPSICSLSFSCFQIFLNSSYLCRSDLVSSDVLCEEIFCKCKVTMANLWKLYGESKRFVHTVVYFLMQAVVMTFAGSSGYSC